MLGRIALAVLAASFVGILLGIALESVPLLLVSTAVGVLADQVAGVLARQQMRWLGRARFGLTVRSLLRSGFFAAGVGQQADFGPAAAAAILTALVALHVGVAIISHFDLLARRRVVRRHAWRNIAVDGEHEGPPPFRFLSTSELGLHAEMTASVELLLVLGVLISALTGSEGWLLVAVGVVLLGIGVIIVLGGMRLASVLGGVRTMAAVGPRGWRNSTAEIDGQNATLRAAVAKLQPEVVVYFSSPANGTYALNVWLSVLESLRERTLIVLREGVHLRTMLPTTVPVIVLPEATDLEAYQVPSMKVALYPTNVIKNNHMVRLEHMLHCFIGHGDSDKAGSFSPVSRVYDEIWVAGPAGAERYAAVPEGFQLERIRSVGRPQLDGIVPVRERPSSVAGMTVLYAPTWEGFFDESDYCSLVGMGEQIVSALIAAGAVVLFKPHPSTGERDPADLLAAERIAHTLERTPGGHRVVENAPDGLYRAFNDADVLITDISSLITDFLFSRKPYIVTNPLGLAPAQFAADFPSTSAAYVLREPVDELPRFLRDVVEQDSLGDRRDVLRAHLLGDGDAPLERFVDEVSGFVRRSEDERIRRRNAAAAVDIEGNIGSTIVDAESSIVAEGRLR